MAGIETLIIPLFFQIRFALGGYSNGKGHLKKIVGIPAEKPGKNKKREESSTWTYEMHLKQLS